ncbi:MAG: hypothetical protein COW71_00455 [Ignavibacteriales bacterium CG18_big_fil_WC_8_21_14_2_50_31_20]|nr:MAG: hypothetical protein COW71_00455 [Ignavibacteriales bacterium CG18_big_fil_WC_8_21_14_2_50_31_20]
MKLKLLILFISIIYIPLLAQLKPQDAIKEINRGINIGNTLEPPNEGEWNNGFLQEYYFDDYKEAGFTCIRIPVRWDKHTATSAPFNINETWFSRVEQIIDWGLKRDLYIIVNAHHEDWLKQNYSNATYKARFDSIWSQVATRFKDKSEKLFFEIINEPFGMTTAEVDDLNSRLIPIIRKTNPTRILIYSGNDYTGSSQMMSASIPNDKYIMAYFHSYDPWSFAGEGTGTWGTVVDRNALQAQFQSVYQWSAINNIPVMISEFGAVKACDYNSRMYHYSSYVEESLSKGIAFQVWDDGGNFGIYERDTRKWSGVKDILTKTYPDGPTRLNIIKSNDTTLAIFWQNRITDSDGIIIQRKIGNEDFVNFAELNSTATIFYDTSVKSNNTYYYRVITNFNDKEDYYSYPVKFYLPNKRSSFLGSPFNIPGTIEAENFDIGGEGLTFHDTDADNIPGAYRPNESVDIESRPDGYQIAYISAGEWLEYTVNVEQSGDYFLNVFLASLDGGGKLNIKVGNKLSETITVPKTNSWTNLTSVSVPITLNFGVQILRINFISAEPFNLDKIVFVAQNPNSVKLTNNLVEFNVYPNPVRGNLNVKMSNIKGNSEITVFNILGQKVRDIKIASESSQIDLNNLARGFYFLRITTNNQILPIRKIIIQ